MKTHLIRTALALVLSAGLVTGPAVAGAIGDVALPSAAAATKVVKPSITKQVSSRTVTAGVRTTFTVKVAGTKPSILWQSKGPGGTWRNQARTTSWTLTTRQSHDGLQVRAVASNGAGTVRSSAATLRVTTKPSIASQPSTSTSVTVGKQVTLSTKARGGHLSYRWQSRQADGTWANVASASGKTATLKFTADASTHGRVFRVVVSNHSGKAYSKSATVRVLPTVAATGGDVWGTAGTTATLGAKASGQGLTYRWQRLNDDTAEWQDLPATASTLNHGFLATDERFTYRVLVKNSAGTVESKQWRMWTYTTPEQPFSLGSSSLFPQSWQVSAVSGSTTIYGYGGDDRTYITSMATIVVCLPYEIAESRDPSKSLTVTALGADGTEYVASDYQETSNPQPLNAVGMLARGECAYVQAHANDIPIEVRASTVWKVHDSISGQNQYFALAPISPR
ncbi:hypothetical protein [Cellulosimicrobium cellulans]|uniref:hypothetical protein n=1 Tax=Cellulosimicrobium cellulans TaxID=1710 RepID=UPI001BA57798|nr:hypothetical protein [Cellulosimicrobium cellulans]QUC00245.1 hypothetical protein J5A69_02970 [Cellulosimicrobium cellulans]